MEKECIEKLRNIYNGLVANGTIKEVPESKKIEVRERFINFYSRFDNRLRKINREKISVQYNHTGGIIGVCTYYKCAYSHVYNY